MNNNNFVDENGIHVSNNNIHNNVSVNSLIQSNCRIFRIKNYLGPIKIQVYALSGNTSSHSSSTDNHKISLNVSSQKSIQTSVAKRDGKIRTINNFKIVRRINNFRQSFPTITD